MVMLSGEHAYFMACFVKLSVDEFVRVIDFARIGKYFLKIDNLMLSMSNWML